MIFEKIHDRISRMKEYCRLKEMQENAAQQAVTDHKYDERARQTHEFIQTIQYVKENLKFEIPDQVRSDVAILLEKLDQVTVNGLADADRLVEADEQYKKVYGEVSKAWKLHYVFLTKSQIGTLKVIKNISGEAAEDLLKEISQAENWCNKADTYGQLDHALKHADDLITNLNMSQEVELFLKKMNMGRATLNDLDPEVLEWIRHEQLSGKIRLQFVMK